MRKPPRSGGGWHAIAYTFSKARAAGGVRAMWKAMASRNACKTCALGMGGQKGGMVNEQGRFPEFCKKSIQAMASDMQPAIPPDLVRGLTFARLRTMSPRDLETMGRVVAPLVAGPDDAGYRQVGWDEAFARLGAGLKRITPDRSFFYFSGRSSNEAGFLLHLFARIYGTNNVNNCSFYCHQASGVGLGGMFGQGTGTVALEDLEHSDLVLVIGGNPASNHPRLMRTLMDLRRRGGKVIVVNPVRETGLVNFRVPSDPISLVFGSDIADLYVQPHIGGDIAFLSLVAKELLGRGAIDAPYLAMHTTGWSELNAHLARLDPVALDRAAGVDREAVLAVADMLCASKATVFAWAMGITHHLHGVDNVRMIGDLALMRGMVGRPGAGLLPLRGHSNIQGLGTIGVTPKLKDEIFARLEGHFGVKLPTAKGLDTMQTMEAVAKGDIKVGWCLGGNLFGSNPDAEFARHAFAQLDQVVYLNTTLNTGHVHGRGRETWVLPVLARDEEPQPTTQESMFSYVRLSDGGAPRHPGPRSEVQVIAGIARAVLGDAGPIPWAALEDHGRIRAAIAAVVPGLEAIADIGTTRAEFTIPGRAVEEPKFKTPDGRARLVAVAVPPGPKPGEFRLMTVRSEGQFNTVVYEDHDRYRGQERRDVVMIHAGDLARLGLKPDQLVTVRSAAGVMTGQRVRTVDVRPGNAVMYYPEANVLIPRAVDPESGTPAFKHAVVTITAEVAAPATPAKAPPPRP